MNFLRLCRIGLAGFLVGVGGLKACAQGVIGIFEQGAEELQEYGQQIAALNLYIGREEKGYQVMEGGLFCIGGITGNEYGLHQTYFGSLASVNPAVAAMPEVGEILALESSMVSGLAIGIQRWKESGWLIPSELEYIGQVDARVYSFGAAGLQALRVALTADSLTMTDDERMRQVRVVDGEMREVAVGVERFAAGVDLLVMGRRLKN